MSLFSLQDGIGRVVKICKVYLNAVADFFQNLVLANAPVRIADGAIYMRNLLTLLVIDAAEDQPTDFLLRFVNVESTKEVVVFYRHVPPTNVGDFLYYCLLRFGKVICERDTFSGVSLISAYQDAGLVRDAASPTEEELNAIMRRYVLEELIHLQIRQQKFESYVKTAYCLFKRFLLENVVNEVSMPLITELAIQEEAMARLIELERECLEKLFDTLEGLRLPGLPAREAVVDCQALGIFPI